MLRPPAWVRFQPPWCSVPADASAQGRLGGHRGGAGGWKCTVYLTVDTESRLLRSPGKRLATAGFQESITHPVPLCQVDCPSVSLPSCLPSSWATPLRSFEGGRPCLALLLPMEYATPLSTETSPSQHHMTCTPSQLVRMARRGPERAKDVRRGTLRALESPGRGCTEEHAPSLTV